MPCEEVSRICELCNEAAVVYCSSDSAFLCCRCDEAVHSANFLVARHLRSVMCCSCGEFHGDLVSGGGIRRRSVCRSCGDLASDESSLSSDCVSSTESSTEVSSEKRDRKVDVKAEGILVNWSRRMVLEGNQAELVTEMARRVLGMSRLRKLTRVPVRVALATSFWMAMRMCGENLASTCRDLKRVERVTGVQAKMILAVECKLRRVVKTRREVTAVDEGWAEC